MRYPFQESLLVSLYFLLQYSEVWFLFFLFLSRVDYQDLSNTEVVRVCNKKPERQCNLSPEEKATVKIVRECRDHYESICQTRYVHKNVTEDKVTCQTLTDQMCDDDGQNCVDFPQKVRLKSSQ